MTAIQLSPAERKDMRAAAHHLSPVVMIGSAGLTPAIRKETEAALDAHGLIKIRVLSDDREHRQSLLAQLSDELGAAPIQHIGKLLVLWRPQAEREAPQNDDRRPGPKIVKIVKFSKSGNHRPQIKKVKVLGNERVAAGGTIKRAKKRLTSLKKRAAP